MEEKVEIPQEILDSIEKAKNTVIYDFTNKKITLLDFYNLITKLLMEIDELDELKELGHSPLSSMIVEKLCKENINFNYIFNQMKLVENILEG
jgi:hypothetical protein